MKVIAFCGSAFSGKTSVCAALIKHIQTVPIYRILYLPFAQPLKDIAYDMGWNGIKDTKGRRLLQLLGTECMRECIDPDGWIKLWQSRIQEDSPQVIITDDLRFPNEADAVHKLNGSVIRIYCTDAVRLNRATSLDLSLPSSDHPSEKMLPDDYVDFAYENSMPSDIDFIADRIYTSLKGA